MTHRVVIHFFADDANEVKYYLVQCRDTAQWNGFDPQTWSIANSRREVRNFFRKSNNGGAKYDAPMKIHQAFAGALVPMGYRIVAEGVSKEDGRDIADKAVVNLQAIGLKHFSLAPQLV